MAIPNPPKGAAAVSAVASTDPPAAVIRQILRVLDVTIADTVTDVDELQVPPSVCRFDGVLPLQKMTAMPW
ncbi:hypothetical protein BWQ96_07851 [Gracilariopsis chorda]|uniref:Uncharacterized protein n=1 Tax=Gracilariopsis chorda TaxID=448386 RepID=A0A2V3IMS0_9FLOR|nr:hypothetical protein BWQ96_07851 [Gracilariopsis chorda]|eukprot:PXF42410.1 hypothetical protein BWQ96_07851 [Gracilariopsis chorda]